MLTPDEARALIAAASNRAPTGVRNRVLMVVLYRTGLRLAEALSLKPADVDLDSGQIRVLKGKGCRARTVAIDPGALTVVQRWVEVRKSLSRSCYLFCTLSGIRFMRRMFGPCFPVTQQKRVS